MAPEWSVKGGLDMRKRKEEKARAEHRVLRMFVDSKFLLQRTYIPMQVDQQ